MMRAVPASVIWRIRIGRTILLAPVATADLVVVTSLAQSSGGRVGYLDALALEDGRRRWTLGGDAGMGLPGGILGPPIVVGDLICAASGAGLLLGLDLGTGEVVWKSQAAGPVVVSPVSDGEQVFFTTEDGRVVALAAQDGEPKWSSHVAGFIRAAPVVVQGAIVVARWGGHVSAMTRDGTALWEVELVGARPTAMVAVEGGVAVFDSSCGDVRAIRVERCSGEWRVTETWRFATGLRMGVHMACRESQVWVLCKDEGRVVSLDAATGSTRWTVPLEGPLFRPVATGSELIVMNSAGVVTSLDAATGRVRWTAATGLSLIGDPTWCHGTLYVGGLDETLYAVRFESARPSNDLDEQCLHRA